MVQNLRLSKNLSQEAVAAKAGLTRGPVCRLERGDVGALTVDTLRAIGAALGMPSIVALGWHAPELERLRDRLHADMVEQAAAALRASGWLVVPEFTFAYFGERGSVDLMAWHAATRTLLIIEIKTRIWDLQNMLAALDRKRRLVPMLTARDRGWRAARVGVVLVLPESSTHRHVIERHAATFEAALPDRQIEVRHWLDHPAGDLRGIWFLPIALQSDIGQRPRPWGGRRAPGRGSERTINGRIRARLAAQSRNRGR